MKASMKGTGQAPSTRFSSVETPVRSNTEYERLLTQDDNSRLISGTTTLNPLKSTANPLLTYHSSNDVVDLENNQLEGAYNEEISSAVQCPPCLDNLSSAQIWLIVIALLVLLVVTIVLYFTGNIDQVIYLWNKIFCWLGLIKCSAEKASNYLTN